MNDNDIKRPDEISGTTVAKGVAILGGGNILLRIFNIAIAVLLLRWLSLFEFGVYRLVLAAYDLAAGFFLAGVENVVVSDVSGGLKKNERTAKSLFSVYFFFMALVGAGLWALFFFTPSFLISWSGAEGRYLRILSFLFLLAPIETVYKLIFQIFLDFGWGTLFRVLREGGRLGLLLIFFFFFSFGIKEVLWSLLVAVALPIAVVIFGYRRPRLIIIPSFLELREALRTLFMTHGRWALLDDFLSNSGKNIRPFIIKTFVGVEAVALVSVAQNLISYTTSLFPIRDVLTPVFPRFGDRPEKLISRINRASKYSTWAYTVFGAGAAVVAPFMTLFLFPKYLPALPFFYIMLLGLPLTGFRSVLVPVFYAFKAQKTLFLLTVLRTVFMVGMGVILTYFFGMWGAVVEITLLGYFITPALTKALRVILPQWQFSLRGLFAFDAYDREILKEIKNRLQGKIAKYFG